MSGINGHLVLEILSISTTLLCIHHLYHYPHNSMIENVISCILAIVSGLLSVLFIDVRRLKFSSFQSHKSSVDHYIAIKVISLVGWFMRRRLEKSTKNISEVQEQFLLQRISENTETEYGREYNFSEIKNRDDFRLNHPLTKRSHFDPYIQKMMDGESKILTSKQPAMFAVTSGTSGKSSVLPTSKKQQTLFFIHGISVAFNSMLQMFPIHKVLNKTLKFFYTPRWRKSKSGLLIGPNSSSPTSTKSLLNLYSTPKAGLDIISEPEALYIHLLFGLKDRELGTLEANFSSTIYTSFKALEMQSESLLKDIENGQINKQLQLDPDIRENLEEHLSPDPARAQEIRDALSEGAVGLAKRLWPNCQLVLCCDTGAFELQAETLKDTYCKDIPIYSPLYAASEGLIGINIWPDKKPSRYMMVPESLFYEFIPIENSHEDQPSTLFIDQLSIDCVYEVVITNTSGLYRYRFGDVIKVESFYNQAPVVEFMYRQGQFLNVRGEKTSEVAFYRALTEASANWSGTDVVDYCCVESYSANGFEDNQESYTPFYHVFVELGNDKNLSEDDKDMVDESLCRMSYVYGSLRNKGSIGPMKIHIAEKGTFQDLRQFIIETTSASSNQYKCPRVLKKKEAIHFVMRRSK